jgi:serine protease Do
MTIAETLIRASTSDDIAALAARLQRGVLLVRSRRGAGAATAWRADGLAVTNSHVVHNDRVEVETHDGSVYPARLTARDEQRDLALLQVDDAALEPPIVRDSSTLRVGEVVLAAGNPWGRKGEVTFGIMTSIDRPAGAPRAGQAIYADVRLAPGNSGGPLADVSGRVVGINSMIANGIAVAVPSNAVQELIAGKRTQRGRLGIVVLPVPVPEAGVGLLISEVHDSSAAQRAGLIVGDVIIGIDGVAGDLDALGERLTTLAAEQRIDLYLLRGGQPRTLSVITAAA